MGPLARRHRPGGRRERGARRQHGHRADDRRDRRRSPTRQPDGVSLGPLLRGETSSIDRPGILLRHVQYPKVAPSFWGLRTERWTYVVYDRSREVELYDNDADPHQLRNLAGSAATADLEQDLAAKLDQLRSG